MEGNRTGGIDYRQTLPSGLVDRAEDIVSGNYLKTKAKIILLIHLCNVCTHLLPEKAEKFWELLVPLKRVIPSEQKDLFNNLLQLNEQSESPSKGMVAEIKSAIKALQDKNEMTGAEARIYLEGLEAKVQTRISPFGKKAAWEAVVNAWVPIDRSRALTISNKLNDEQRKNLVCKMNSQETLKQGDWTLLEKATTIKNITEIAINILDGVKPVLNLPPNLIEPVAQRIYADMVSSLPGESIENSLIVFTNRIDRFFSAVVNEENNSIAERVLQDLFRKAIAKDNIFEPLMRQELWPLRFKTTENLISIGIKVGLITLNNQDNLINLLPSHLADMARAHSAAYLTDEGSARPVLAKLIGAGGRKKEAELYYLVNLARRGFGNLALSLAKESERSGELVPKISRACLCADTQQASAYISKNDVEGDSLTEIKLCKSDQERVEYLREKTEGGHKTLPEDLWGYTEVEEKKSWISRMLTTQTVTAEEYVARNPFYSCFESNTITTEQFREYLRHSLYGEYSCIDIDSTLLPLFVKWNNEKPEEVSRLMGKMWQGIKPSDNLIIIDNLRTSIFTRCYTLFAVIPEFMADQFLTWLNNKLVTGGIKWNVGKTEYTLKLSDQILPQYCVNGAINLKTISPSCSDCLLEMAMTRYYPDQQLVEKIAQIYNSGKEVLDCNLPWEKKLHNLGMIESWQVGIVKNALAPILEAVSQEMLHNIETAPAAEKICQECGILNPPQAKFCAECGKKIN